LFRDFAQQFLETAQLECKPKTHVFYEDRIRQLRPWFGAKRLDEITAPTIREFKESRLKQGLRGTTVNRDLGTLRRVLGLAVKDGILLSSPFFARQIEFLPENGCERVISLAEEKFYLESACSLLRDVAVIMLEMGLRPEEVFELHARHVHPTARPPYVHIPEGKTPKARRDVPITAKAMSVIHSRLSQSEVRELGDAQWDAYSLKRDRRFASRKAFNRASTAEREAELCKAGVTESEIEVAKKRLRERGRGYLFPQRVGTGSDYTRAMNDLHHAHERALKASGIEPRFRIYDLRHTYGTRAIEAGLNPLTLAKLMGHADLKTTQRYVHLSKQHLGEAQRRMEEFRAVLEIADAEQRAVRAVHNSGKATESAQWKN
jgi:integrase